MEDPHYTDSNIALEAKLQNARNLCVLELAVNPPNKYDPSAKSMFHWRILKCRQLIMCEPQIIACPRLETDDRIHAIMTWTFFESPKVQSLLAGFQMTLIEPKAVTELIYESCLRYTICTRIAPLWNQVGCYLVHGRNFLETNSFCEAVKLDISIAEDGVFISFWPTMIKLQQITIEDLDIPGSVKEDFLTNKINNISEVHMPQEVRVLPGLEAGQVVRISRNIPERCPYPSYKELKNHWKNMYGYMLPKEPKLFYYSISTDRENPTLYTYPSLCVVSKDIWYQGPRLRISIIRSFHNSLMRRLPSICGEEMKTYEKLASALPDPCSSNTFMDNSRDQNFVNFEEHDEANETSINEETATVCLATSDESRGNSPDMHLRAQHSQLVSIHCQKIGVIELAESSDNETDDYQAKIIPVYAQKLHYNEQASLEMNQRGSAQSTNSPTDSQNSILHSSYEDNMQQNGENVRMGQVQIETPQNKMIQEVPPGRHFKLSADSAVSSNVHRVSLPGHDLQEPDAKKPRTKPQIRDDMDIEQLARNNKLGQVNKVTLLYWLRERHVPCKVKDSKPALVYKVMEHLNLAPLYNVSDS